MYLLGILLGKRFRIWYHSWTGHWRWGVIRFLADVEPPKKDVTAAFNADPSWETLNDYLEKLFE